MEQEKKTVIDWIKEHKKQLIIAGVSIAAIVAVIFGIKNSQELEAVLDSLKKKIEKDPEKLLNNAVNKIEVHEIQETLIRPENTVPIRHVPHDVTEHIRNLPDGYKPSLQKLALAEERGIELLPGQTFVEKYRTREFVA